jgi:hypothetical protein
MRALSYRFRTELRAGWRRWLLLAVVAGVVAGSVLALAAGARRTDSAHDRFLAAQRAYDVVVGSCAPRESDAFPAQTRCFDDLARLPAVAGASTISLLPAHVETADGRFVQPDPDPCYSGPGQVELVGASPPFGTAEQKYRFVEGRAADPGAPHEVVISEEMARRLDLGPGSELRVRLFAGGECQAGPASALPPVTVRVVGVQLSPGEVAPPSGFYLQSVAVTPAFMDSVGEGSHTELLALRLRPETSVEDLRAEARHAGADIEIVLDQARTTEAVDRGIRPVTVSLAVLAAMLALAGAAVVGQLLVRQAWLDSGDAPTLSALGLNRAQRTGLGLVRAGVIGVGAALVAVAVALAASPLLPVGLARRVEPNRGLDLDSTLVGVGALVSLAFIVAVGGVAAWLASAATVRTAAQKGPATRRGLASAAARAGFRPTVVSAMRLALERGSGASAVPVLSSFLGLTIAVAAVAGALTFGAGLAQLRDSPRLIGWNWDIVLLYPEDPEDNEPSAAVVTADDARARRMLAMHPGVDDYAVGTFWPPFPTAGRIGPDRLAVDGFIGFDGAAAFGPSVIDGRKPSAANEVLLGPRTLDALGLHIGEDVEVVGQSWEGPPVERTARVQIVGTGVVPLSEQFGEGAAMTLDGLARLNREVAAGGAVYVRLAPGADADAVADAFRAAFTRDRGSTVQVFGGLEDADASGVAPLLDVLENLEEIDAVSGLFAVLMGLMAAAVLGHVLVNATHERRRDLAVLRAFGFSRRQVVDTVGLQAAIYVVVALAVGVPVGLAVGRFVWRLYASFLGVVPDPVTPWSAFAAVATAALLVALLVASTPAWRAARRPPADALRAE